MIMMKKLLCIITCLLVTLLSIVSCCDYYDEFYDGNGDVDTSEYYVKYTVSSNYPYIFSDVTYADVYGTGSMMDYQTRGWTVTIGPVRKGFHAFVRNANGKATNKIEISKNGGPFALKASGENQASYTINF